MSTSAKKLSVRDRRPLKKRGAARRQLAASGTSIAQTLGNIASDAAKNRIDVATANNETWVAQAEAAYKSAQDTLAAAGDDYDRLIAERDRIDQQIKDRYQELLQDQEVSANLDRLSLGRSINLQGVEITQASDYLNYLRNQAAQSVLGAPTGSAKDPNGLGAVYGQIMDKLAELETLRTELGQIGSITPIAGTSTPPSAAPGT